MEIPEFRYMAWAKAHAGRGSHPLHRSDAPGATLADLGVDPSALQLHRPPSPRPDPALAEAVASRYGVPVECVMPTCGTHHANFLLARVLAGPGTRVLVEHPVYEALPRVFETVGAEVRSFPRRREDRGRLPVDRIREGLKSDARVVVVTDLHNPTGVRLQPEDLASLEAAAREREATVLVDEVYRDFLPPPVGTSFVPGGPFAVTSSLTKVYGLGGLRVGWALAAPEVVDRMRRLNDLVVVNMPAPSASIALAAWPRLEAIAARHRETAARNFRVLSSWVRGRDDLLWSPPDGGVAAFLEVPALAGKDDAAWVEALLEATGVCVVPGSMFGAPGSIRLSFGLPTDAFTEALDRLGGFLDRSR
jgi:aspartate/methionine/tyrosine aminotransferase